MKNILQLLCISLVVGTVMAGTEIYNPVFYGPVAIGQWSAVSNFAGVAATNGAYTNSVTYQYRLTATNSLGRLPYTVTNSVVLDGAANNSAHLTWTYTPRVSCYILERGTTGTWDQFVRVGASLTNAWDDGSSLVWMNGNYAATNECALSDFPTGSIPVVGITAGTYYDGANGDYVSNAVVWKTDTNGWVVSAHEAWLTTEVDPAYATGAVQLAGATMTGGLTNEFGYFGNGAGLTNLASDPSGWSGYAATQQVVWYSDEISDDTNYLVISGSSEPETAGVYQWANSNEVWAYWKDGDKVAPQGEDFWYIFTSVSEFRNYTTDPTAGGYDAYFNATGTVSAAYGKMTNTIPWRAGYDSNSDHWAISCNGMNIQEWSRPPSIIDTVYTIIKGYLTVDGFISAGGGIYAPSIMLNGAYRETWPSEYDDSAIYGALNTVSNWTIAGSNLAYALSGNLSAVSNQVAGASNLAWAIGAGGSNYADSVGAAVGLVASNALSMDGGGTVTGDVAVTGGMTAGTLALTNGPVAGSVWVCTNANGSGELRQLAKMRLKPFGSALISGINATNKWNATGYSVGGLTGTVDGVKIHRAGSYLVGMNWTANYCTNPAQVGKAAITLNNAVIANTEYNSQIANNAIQSVQTLVTEASAGDIIGVNYRVIGESSGQTNMASGATQLSVVELP